MINLMNEDRFKSLVSSFSSLDPVLVLGDVGIDKYTFGEVNRISPEAPVPILEVTSEWPKLGLAANVSDNLGKLGVSSTLLSVIGDDNYGDMLENLLEENNLSTWGLVRSNERKTTFKERIVTHAQQICRIDYESKEEVSSTDIDKVLLRASDFLTDHSSLIIEDYGKGLLSHDLCSKVISLYREKGKFVAIDPSRNANALTYKGANLLKPNRLEAEHLVKDLGYREKKISKIIEILLDKLDLDMVVVTLGAEGMAYMDRQNRDSLVTVIPTLAAEVFDVSGAGDTAISVLTSSLLAGANLAEACFIANCASGVVVGKRGTACVEQSELFSFYKKVANLQQDLSV